jgi:hypothetical protein
MLTAGSSMTGLKSLNDLVATNGKLCVPETKVGAYRSLFPQLGDKGVVGVIGDFKVIEEAERGVRCQAAAQNLEVLQAERALNKLCSMGNARDQLLPLTQLTAAMAVSAKWQQPLSFLFSELLSQDAVPRLLAAGMPLDRCAPPSGP